MTRALTLVVCGAPLAARAADLAAVLVADGWAVTTVASPAARDWIDSDAVQRATAQPVLIDQRSYSLASSARPDAVVACPLTLNSLAKTALGIMDTYATGVLCEAVAARIPLTVVTTISTRLWGHPSLPGHLETLTAAGVTFVSPITGRAAPAEPVRSGSGDQVVAGFDPAALARHIGAPGKP